MKAAEQAYEAFRGVPVIDRPGDIDAANEDFYSFKAGWDACRKYMADTKDDLEEPLLRVRLRPGDIVELVLMGNKAETFVEPEPQPEESPYFGA